MSRYKTDVLHTVKCAYRILKLPLSARVERHARQKGMSPGTRFNFLVRERLADADPDEYEPTERAMLYFPNLVIKQDRKQYTLYLSEAENKKLESLCKFAALDKNKAVTALLTDALQKNNAL